MSIQQRNSQVTDCIEDHSSGDAIGDAFSATIFTSRISIQKFLCVVSQFSNYKRTLAEETGFGGLLQLKITHKINLKFSASLVERVDPESCTLVLDDTRKIPIRDQDVSDVFGLLIGTRPIPTGQADLSDACIEFSKLAMGISTKGIHSLKAAEAIVSRHVDENSTKVQTECFKIAFVVLAVGHVLNPCAKHDYTSVDFWPAMVLPAEINSYNWCRFVRENLMKAVRKIKADLASGNNTVHIVGCHLLLQVLALDKIHASSRHIIQKIVPRVKAFNHESVKKAIEAISQQSGAETVYAGHEFTLNGSNTSICYADNGQNMNSADPSMNVSPDNSNVISKPIFHAIRKNRSSQAIGSVDFANQMRRKYPQMAGDFLGILLKEHNSRVMSSMNDIRHSTQMAMFTFVDELVECLKKRCICCQLSGRTSCTSIANMNQAFGGTHGMEDAPIIDDDGEGSSTGHIPNPRKRLHANPSQRNTCDAHIATTLGQPTTQTTNVVGKQPSDVEAELHGNHDATSPSPFDTPADICRLISFHRGLFDMLQNMYSKEHGVTFGQCTDQPMTPQNPTASASAIDPWAAGNITQPPPPVVTQFLVVSISNDSEASLRRPWFHHPQPRVLVLKGEDISKQIIGTEMLSHECCTLIIRRMAQIERSSSRRTGAPIWRKFMEPDFSTLVISNIDPCSALSVQREFTTEDPISQSRMFILPTPLHDGWCYYIFDMIKKRIVVIDPQAGTLGFSSERIKFHEHVCSRLLSALFCRVQSFFSSWACNETGWIRQFPNIMDQSFQREESGICSLFMAANFDGEKLVLPTTKENIWAFRRSLLYDLMKLEGNQSNIPSLAMESIRSSMNYF